MFGLFSILEAWKPRVSAMELFGIAAVMKSCNLHTPSSMVSAWHQVVLRRTAIIEATIGAPGLSIPVGLADDNMPVGFQLQARPGRHLLSTCYEYTDQICSSTRQAQTAVIDEYRPQTASIAGCCSARCSCH